MPNISTVRSIQYDGNSMNVFKASGVGKGVSVPYKQLNFESDMRVISPFENLIEDQEPTRAATQ